jgi:hypothetical protein
VPIVTGAGDEATAGFSRGQRFNSLESMMFPFPDPDGRGIGAEHPALGGVA